MTVPTRTKSKLCHRQWKLNFLVLLSQLLRVFNSHCHIETSAGIYLAVTQRCVPLYVSPLSLIVGCRYLYTSLATCLRVSLQETVWDLKFPKLNVGSPIFEKLVSFGCL